MGKRREAVRVNLTPRQRRELERLWFAYGNYGPKTTKGNHSFIQGLLERGLDERPLRMKGYIPTEECERAVEKILHSEERHEEDAEEHPRLRLVHSETRKPITIDPEAQRIDGWDEVTTNSERERQC